MSGDSVVLLVAKGAHRVRQMSSRRGGDIEGGDEWRVLEDIVLRVVSKTQVVVPIGVLGKHLVFDSVFNGAARHGPTEKRGLLLVQPRLQVCHELHIEALNGMLSDGNYSSSDINIWHS